MALVSLFAAAAMVTSAARCEGLLRHELAGGRVVASEAIPATPTRPAACRVKLELRPTPMSRIGVEVWLPFSGWTGRFVQLGTGGFAGTIPQAGLEAEIARGHAAAATDTGHVGADSFDASWASGAPERVVDYGHRSLKTSAIAAQAITTAFYGDRPRHRYFVGCSNGGRQALMIAQRYPDLFDGIVAGSPALRWSAQLASFARIQQALRRPGAMIPAAKLPAIQAAARAGRTPARCRGSDTDDCLTPPQLAALALIARDFDPRYAATPGGWDAWIVNPDPAAQTQLTLAEQFFRHMVLDDPNWRVEDLSAADLRRARALSPILDATDADLSGFRRRGGKLLIYAGEADPLISPRAAVDYYRSLGEPDFARLFLIPGMLHCQGGPAPAAFGQAPVAPALRRDAAHDIRLALEEWVEAGRPPGSLVAVKYVGDDPARGVAATARICPVTAAGRACASVD